MERVDLRVLLDDGMQIPLGTGIGKYSEHLARAIGDVDGICIDVSGFSPDGRNRASSRIAYLRHINSIEYRRKAESYDLVIFTNYAMPFRKLCTHTAVTVHDLATYDCPNTLPKPYVPYSRAMIRNSVQRADLVVTVSESIRKDIVERFRCAARKTQYAWPGVVDRGLSLDVGNPYDDLALAEAASHPFFLMVGTVERRKNVLPVIDAFSRLVRSGNGFENLRLILAGRPGFGFDEIERAAEAGGCRGSIVFTGYVSDNDCGNLYRDARAVVFPSVYEGFGSIQIECMAMGVPLILSDIPTNREVSEGYGVFFELGDIDGLVSAMREVGPLSDAQRNVASLALNKASWAGVANCYLDAVLREGGR